MSQAKDKAQAELASRLLSRRRLLPFVQRINPRYLAGWVHGDICRRLEKFSDAVAKGLSPRLMILMPPRSGKSELCSRAFPSWYLGRNPNHEIIACSYNVSLAMSFSKKVKEVLEDPAFHPVFDIRLNPNNQSAEEWSLDGKRGGYVAAGVGGGITGKGAHCLPAGTKISTVAGPMNIDALYLLKYKPKVYSFDQGTKRVVLREIRAFSTRLCPELFEITTSAGRTLVMTGDHPVYLPDTDEFVRADRLETLYGTSQDTDRSHLCNVWDGISTRPLQPQQVDQTELPRLLLLEGMQPAAPLPEEPQGVSALRTAGDRSWGQQRSKVLQQGVLARCASATRGYLSSVWRRLRPDQCPEYLLLPRLCERGALGQDGRGEQLALQRWAELRQVVPGDAAPDSRARPGLCGLQEDLDPTHSPRGSRPYEQQTRELGAVVPGPPHDPPQVGYDSLALVRRVRGGPVTVYDLEVEGTHNFFANDICVHNCLIIDDPLKNAEEADSADTREKLWDWYGSTAYTRLAPGGGVLVVQCMVGDTPVLMADGAERRLDSLVAGDEIATFDQGRLVASKVSAIRSNGRDPVLEITTISGKIVRANGRHPFMVTLNGELKWIRARSLTTDHKIVALRDSGGSGKGSLVQQMAALSLPAAEASALPTTIRKNGPMERARQASTLDHDAKPTSSTATDSLSRTTRLSIWHKEECVGSVESCQEMASPTTGRTSSPSTTATTPVRFEASCATTATQESDILELSPWHSPRPNTSDFTLDEIVSIVPAGVEEVFDLQVERTENFIANGLVSHNTWWHDDDLAGRLQNAMSADPHADQFVVVKYPALAEFDEYLDHDSDLIVDEPPANGVLLRKKGEALHPERYDVAKLEQIKRTISPRFWSALYQQNPVPDDGAYFLKEHFRRAPVPHISRCNVFIAWDFAISEKKQNDYTVGTVLLQDEDDTLHVAEQLRFKSADAFYIVEAILGLSKKWYTSGQRLGFEDGQIYRAIESLLKKRMRERHEYPAITVLKPISDKLARARPLQGRMQQGRVSFNSDGEWYDTCRLEMLRFPAGTHDDCVDSVSWATQMAIGSQPPRRPASKALPSWRDRIKHTGSKGSFMSA